MKLIYIGGHLEVEVPLDDGTSVIAQRHGPAVDVPAETAKGLLEQGHETVDNGEGTSTLRPVDPQWKKATGRSAAGTTTEDGDA